MHVIGDFWVALVGFFAVAASLSTSENRTRLRRNPAVYRRPLLEENIELAEALFNGIIGMTAESVIELVGRIKHFIPHLSAGGCEWFGNAPFCTELCPAEYDQIREESGRCTTPLENGTLPSLSDRSCTPDPSFGEPCTDIFGFQFKKKFCCKSDPKDCTWSGRWMGAMDSFNIYCRYDSTVGRCGKLDCSVNHRLFQGHNSSLIAGEHCDELDMWLLKGKATCGYIAWYNEEGRLANSWYKTH